MKYAWIDEHRDQYSVTRMCRQLEVSRTGYGQWRTRPPSDRALANAVLDAQVAAMHAGSQRSYGRPRIVRGLRAQGVPVSHERVRKSLQRQGLRPVYRRPYRVTTDAAHHKPIAPNVLDRRVDGWHVNQAFPSLHMRQRPHAMLNGTDTMSPTRMNSTSRPASSTSPVISCPRTRPRDAVVRPRTMCWSLPQMLVVMIFRITPCWHWRLPRASVGKSIDWISTTPGSMNASPRLLLIGASLRSESSDPIQLDLAREALVPGTCAHPRRRQGPSTTDSHEPQENTHSDSFLQVSSTGSPGLRGHPEEPGVPGPVRSGQRHRDGLPDDTTLRRRYPLS